MKKNWICKKYINWNYQQPNRYCNFSIVKNIHATPFAFNSLFVRVLICTLISFWCFEHTPPPPLWKVPQATLFVSVKACVRVYTPASSLHWSHYRTSGVLNYLIYKGYLLLVGFIVSVLVLLWPCKRARFPAFREIYFLHIQFFFMWY